MDTQKQKELMISWLKDACAMEKKLEETLEAYAKGAEDYPELQEKLEEHIDVTKNQQERLKARIEALGESVSTMKMETEKIMGKMAGTGTSMGFGEDSVVKNSVLAFSAEYMEIGSYTAIATVAKSIGDDETVTLVNEIITEEQAMADWAESHLQGLVKEFLEKEE
jgi:ferritin-like metal-binding protein YciE